MLSLENKSLQIRHFLKGQKALPSPCLRLTICMRSGVRLEWWHSQLLSLATSNIDQSSFTSRLHTLKNKAMVLKRHKVNVLRIHFSDRLELSTPADCVSSVKLSR
jgi:hypothetical protein